MLAEKIRRLLVCTLALALAAGLVTHSVPSGKSGPKAADMTTTVSMDAAADLPMHSKCDGCAGDEKGLMPTACAAFCGSVIALPLPVIFHAGQIVTMWPPAGTDATGHTAPPDPYPPRPVVLS